MLDECPVRGSARTVPILLQTAVSKMGIWVAFCCGVMDQCPLEKLRKTSGKKLGWAPRSEKDSKL
jgi:hypothetical protein